MGIIIPFQNKQQTIETSVETLLLKIRQGKFSPASSYSRGIIQHLETASIDEIDKFLVGISLLVEAIDWKYPFLSKTETERANAIGQQYFEAIQIQSKAAM